jgi:hypothetical protein
MLSVYLLFEFSSDAFTQTLAAFSVGATLVDVFIKSYLHNSQGLFKDKDILFAVKFYWKDLFNILYTAFFYFHIDSQFFLYYIVDAIVLFLLY